MRGVLSAGALFALDTLGYRDCFDAIFATSAGSVNAAYFLSGQGALGITVYFEDLNDSRFLNPWRFWKILDVDYVYDEVVKKTKPLNEGAIRKAKTTFFVTVTDVNSGANVLYDVTHSNESIPLLLKASSALPVLYNRTVQVNGSLFVDGGVSGGPPLDCAIKLGFTDILFLPTRPKGFVGTPPSTLQQLAFRLSIGKRYPLLMKAFQNSNAVKTEVQRLSSGIGVPEGVSIASFYADIDERHPIGRTTTSRETLIAGARRAATGMSTMLTGDSLAVAEMFDGFARESR